LGLTSQEKKPSLAAIQSDVAYAAEEVVEPIDAEPILEPQAEEESMLQSSMMATATDSVDVIKHRRGKRVANDIVHEIEVAFADEIRLACQRGTFYEDLKPVLATARKKFQTKMSPTSIENMPYLDEAFEHIRKRVTRELQLKEAHAPSAPEPKPEPKLAELSHIEERISEATMQAVSVNDATGEAIESHWEESLEAVSVPESEMPMPSLPEEKDFEMEFGKPLAQAAPTPTAQVPAAQDASIPAAQVPAAQVTPIPAAQAIPIPAAQAPAASVQATPALAAQVPAVQATPASAAQAPAASVQTTPAPAAQAPAASVQATPAPAAQVPAASVQATPAVTASTPASAEAQPKPAESKPEEQAASGSETPAEETSKGEFPGIKKAPKLKPYFFKLEPKKSDDAGSGLIKKPAASLGFPKKTTNPNPGAGLGFPKKSANPEALAGEPRKEKEEPRKEKEEPPKEP